jgi:hypothetical protein
MASKARQSVLGGFFGLSLNFVILPFFIRLCCLRRIWCKQPHLSCVGDEEHAAIDDTDGIEA